MTLSKMQKALTIFSKYSSEEIFIEAHHDVLFIGYHAEVSDDDKKLLNELGFSDKGEGWILVV